MATILEQYEAKQAQLHTQLAAGSARQECILHLQELNYRISVLKSMQAFCLSAPISMNMQDMRFHYQLLYSYVHGLCEERKIGPKADESVTRQRDTAAESLNRVCMDHWNRFASFHVTKEDQYREAVCKLANTVLPAWIQYRNTYVNI